MGLSSLFGENYLLKSATSLKSEVKPLDEIDILVNGLLSEKSLSYRDIQRSNVKEDHYFIQLAAYSKYKPSKLILKLQEHGYKTTIKSAKRGDKKVNLLLVGPYLSRGEAQKNLPFLKDVERNAFICKRP